MSKTNSVNATKFKHSEVDELFNLVKTGEGIIICVGNNKVSRKTFKTFKQADEYIRIRPYEILINVSILIQTMYNENKENSPKGAAVPTTSAENVENGK